MTITAITVFRNSIPYSFNIMENDVLVYEHLVNANADVVLNARKHFLGIVKGYRDKGFEVLERMEREN